MYSKKDLFSLRENVGVKIGSIMRENSITKAALCKKTGISRPTIDKILEGSITNKTNYDKHISKVLDALNITPDILLGNMKKNKTKVLRQIMKKSINELAEATGISVVRVQEIEAGAEPSISELRDIALYLSTSVNVIQEKNFFKAQVSEMDVLVKNKELNRNEEISGFWGHIGIMPQNGHEYKWYPITKNARADFYNEIDRKSIVITCMNNKVLYLNMKNINKIVLVDDDCDGAYDCNWPKDISEGEIPLVIYEALEDYLYDERDKMSPKFYDLLEKIIKKYEWSEEDIYSILNDFTVYYNDGRNETDKISFDEYENISENISYVYNYYDFEEEEHVFYYVGYDGREVVLNRENIAMIELPLLSVENAINRQME